MRADRDAMLIELRTAKDTIANQSKGKEDTKNLVITQTKSIKNAENEIIELRKQLRIKEDSTERLMQEVILSYSIFY